MAVISLTTKTCTKCGEAKQLAAFYKCKKIKDGLQGHCKSCDTASRAPYSERKKAQTAAWRAANQEHIKAKRASYYTANANKVKAKAKAWAKANPERLKVRRTIYYAANAERIKTQSAAWVKANLKRSNTNKGAWASAHPEINRTRNQNRRARKIAAGGRLSQGLAEKLFKSQRGLCPCCGSPLGTNYHLDHIVPLKLGGPNSDDNMQLLRQQCNNQKGAKHPVDFMQSRGFLL